MYQFGIDLLISNQTAHPQRRRPCSHTNKQLTSIKSEWFSLSLIESLRGTLSILPQGDREERLRLVRRQERSCTWMWWARVLETARTPSRSASPGPRTRPLSAYLRHPPKIESICWLSCTTIISRQFLGLYEMYRSFLGCVCPSRPSTEYACRLICLDCHEKSGKVCGRMNFMNVHGASSSLYVPVAISHCH